MTRPADVQEQPFSPDLHPAAHTQQQQEEEASRRIRRRGICAPSEREDSLPGPLGLKTSGPVSGWEREREREQASSRKKEVSALYFPPPRLPLLLHSHEGVQSGCFGVGRSRQIGADGPVRDGLLHREVRPDDRGFLQEGDRGGLFPFRAGDPGHGGDRAVRLHARPVHQERPGLHPGLQPGEPAELPGHQTDEGPDHPGEAVRAGAHDPGGEQGGPGGGERGVFRGGQGAGPGLELPLHGDLSQKQGVGRRTVRGDRETDELLDCSQRWRPVLLVCPALKA